MRSQRDTAPLLDTDEDEWSQCGAVPPRETLSEKVRKAEQKMRALNPLKSYLFTTILIFDRLVMQLLARLSRYAGQ